jgi:CBS domain-containing protein
MAHEEPMRQKVQSRIDELKALRDQIRVDLRLATMELRDEWRDLEKKLPDPSVAAEQIRGATSEALERLESELRKFRSRLHAGTETTSSVAGVMSRPAVSCTPSDSLARAVTVMWERDIGFLPVLDPQDKIAGAVTDRDATIAAATRGQRLDEIRVESVMSRDVAVCAPNDSPAQALALMKERQIRRLPVVEHGRLIGVITLTDLARLCAGSGDKGASGVDARAVVEVLTTIGTRRQ